MIQNLIFQIRFQLYDQRILFLTDLALWAAISTLSFVMPVHSFVWVNQVPFFEAASSYYYSATTMPPKRYLRDNSPKAQEIVKNYKKIIDF